MDRRFVLTTLALLTLVSHGMRPCLGQAGGQNAAAPSRNAEAEYAAPANDIGVVSSECGFRFNATRKVMPEFPAEALRAGAEGVVVLSLYHDGAGDAARIKVVESPHRVLTEAAIEAVKQWKWRRFMSGGIDRPILGKLSFRFVVECEAGRVEDAVNDCDKSRVNWSLSDIRALRLRATWPDGGGPNEP